MSAEQSTSAERAIQSIYERARAVKGKGNTLEAIRERRVVDDEAFAWIDSRLSPEQKLRLAQIDLQWEGPSALVSRLAVTRAMDLSKEQIAKLDEAVKRRNAHRAKGRTDADSILTEVALSCLNNSQREIWKQMLGAPFTFTPTGRPAAQPAPR